MHGYGVWLLVLVGAVAALSLAEGGKASKAPASKQATSPKPGAKPKSTGGPKKAKDDGKSKSQKKKKPSRKKKKKRLGLSKDAADKPKSKGGKAKAGTVECPLPAQLPKTVSVKAKAESIEGKKTPMLSLMLTCKSNDKAYSAVSAWTCKDGKWQKPPGNKGLPECDAKKAAEATKNKGGAKGKKVAKGAAKDAKDAKGASKGKDDKKGKKDAAVKAGASSPPKGTSKPPKGASKAPKKQSGKKDKKKKPKDSKQKGNAEKTKGKQ